MRTSEEKTPAAANRHTTPFFEKNGGQHFFGTSPKPDSFFQKSPASFSIQPKLTIGQPNDKYEQEADAVAQQVVSTSAPVIQKKCTDCEKEDRLQKQSLPEEEKLQMQPMEEEEVLQTQSMEEEEDLQMKPSLQLKDDARSGGKTKASPWVQKKIDNSKGSGQPLDSSTRSFMESRMQMNFSRVSIHTDDKAVQMNREMGARAFTVGSDIYFNKGEYRPETTEGKKLLAHELTHTVQQGKTKKIQRAVDAKKVSCSGYAADHPTITVIGTVDPVGTLKAANAKAVSLLQTTIATLEYIRGEVSKGAPPSYPTFSDCLAASLKKRFNMDPESKDTWVGKGKTETLVKWYKKFEEILSGDTMWYTCIDKFADCGVTSWGAAIAGQYRIYLCKPWWYATVENQALTLIHETSHIYYDTDDHIGTTIMNAHCLEKFVAETNNVPILKQFESGCGGANKVC